MDEKTVLAIDPGSKKCGMALVHRDGSGKLTLVWNEVVPTADVPAKVGEVYDREQYSLMIVGSGTTSRPLVEAIRDVRPGLAILVVDERDTTLQARERYWEHKSRFGWRKFIPATLQVPPEPFDDFVALILAERVLSA